MSVLDNDASRDYLYAIRFAEFAEIALKSILASKPEDCSAFFLDACDSADADTSLLLDTPSQPNEEDVNYMRAKKLHLTLDEMASHLFQTQPPDHPFLQLKLYLQILAAGLSRGTAAHEWAMLHHAVRWGHLSVITTLAEGGFDVQVLEISGVHPVHSAAQCGQLHVVHHYIKTLDVDIDLCADNGKSILQFAVEASQMHVVEDLMEEGADLAGLLRGAACSGNEEALRMAFVERVDINQMDKDGEGQRPIHLAAARGSERIVELLLRFRANVNVEDGNGQTPLSYCDHHNHLKVAKRLIKAGADLGGLLRGAARFGSCVSIERALSARVDVNQRSTEGGRTALHQAVLGKSVQAVKLLLAAKGDPTVSDTKGLSAIDSALQVGDSHVVMTLEPYRT
eukprot:NODE_2711_length_1358_cov_71.780567_g2575_i0.p1 GENE.NODE_2711_length_1358_cov_71.780567_g2575_i0~~NODE_2711_length_1358_cov_71.780567_g2575_i0.p1  ORF type:complete len:397 (+),score=69.83 NODE_2711_length_1358_cov_71.780567_g2575_i0:90-1280(+)